MLLFFPQYDAVLMIDSMTHNIASYYGRILLTQLYFIIAIPVLHPTLA